MGKVMPDVWGQGCLFAFSGLDGPTCWKDGFVGSTLGHEVGVKFHTKVPRSIKMGQAEDVARIQGQVVTGDLLVLDVELKSGELQNVVMAFLDKDTVIGTTSIGFPPMVNVGEFLLKEGDISEADDGWTALFTEQIDDRIKFSLSFTSSSRHGAESRAKAGLDVDMEGVVESKLSFLKGLPTGDIQDPDTLKTLMKAFSVLKTNIESPQGLIKHTWTTPDRFPHKNMWLWDSAFHAIGVKHISVDVAKDALRAVVDHQREDGFIPIMMTPKGALDITQPPILTWGTWEIYEADGDEGFLEEMYLPLSRYVEWDMENRDGNSNGLLEWLISGNPLCRSGESGMDNSPRFDDALIMDAVDFSSFIANEMELLSKMAQILGREEDVSLWRTRAKYVASQVNKILWDDEEGFYYDRALDGGFVKVKTTAGFTPLFAGIPSRDMAKRLVEEHLLNEGEFWTPFPLPSTSADEPTFSLDMWRGPTWINYNFLIIKGLKRYGYHDVAARIADKILQEISKWYIREGVIFEYYDSMGRICPRDLDRKKRLSTGKGIPCINDYNWSAAIYIELSLGDYRGNRDGRTL